MKSSIKQNAVPTSKASGIFLKGIHDGIPIALGYYAVAFSIGIIAAKAGVSTLLGGLGSFFTRASAGEYGVYSLVIISASYIEVIGMSLIANLRYLLMGAALTQKIAKGTSTLKRILMSCCITDEIFGISIAYPGNVPASYMFGASLVSTFAWAGGTASGIIAGDILPRQIVSALGVALYGMFIAIIIPPCRKNHAVGIAVGCSFLTSWGCSVVPFISDLSAGIRTIILTIAISALAAWLKPIKQEQE